jgi:hypothetical protein
MLDQEDCVTGEVIPGQWKNANGGTGTLAPLRSVGRRAPVDAYTVHLEFANYFSSHYGHIERKAIVE